MGNLTRKTCSVCGRELECGSAEAGKKCWCAGLPAIMSPESGQDCQCPECLAKTIGRQIENRLASCSHEDALALAAGFAATQTLTEHIDYTLEHGNLVFSTWYHLKRGTCCHNGCRHCPYDRN